jgi:hypothetical protein
LENLVDHVDGMLTFIVDFNLKVMSYILSGGLAEDPETANKIKETIVTFKLNVFSEEDLMDIGLLAMTVLSYTLVKR